METRIKFKPGRSQYVVQTRETWQWWWRTCRMPCVTGFWQPVDDPIFFASRAEALEFIDKMQLKAA